MEVMRSAVVKYRTLKPLPGEITSAKITDAALPLKIEAARRAIAACTDLPELLKMKDQAEGLAAAVRIMKTVGPEMIRNANCLLADAWRKGGELLSQYSNIKGHVSVPPASNGRKPTIQNFLSERGKAATAVGITRRDAALMARVAAAPKDLVESVVQKTVSLEIATRRLPRVRTDQIYFKGAKNPKAYSDVLRPIMHALVGMKSHATQVDLLSFSVLQPDERKAVKAKIVEIQEILDVMDQLCQ